MGSFSSNGTRALVSPLLDDDSLRLVCADNLGFLRRFETESIQLVLTSPPYNLEKEYEERRDFSSYVQEQAKVAAECVRVLKPGGSICWQVGHHVSKGEVYPLDIILYPIFKNLGMRLRNRIIWHFEHGLHCSKRLSGRHESILWFTKTDDYVFNLDEIRVPPKYPGKRYYKGPRKGELSCNPLGKNPGDVWLIPNVKFNHIEKTEHPCQFPVELAERLVLALSDRGDDVLDPYAGVGSTLIAALKSGRYGHGCEIIQRYVDIGRQRIQALRSGALKTRPISRAIYQPRGA